ncbi:hypothetical protein BDN67DRAFT_914167, partial [Paxillus ammoniavirescens]
PPFSLEQLHDHLVAFIVADDQVRIAPSWISHTADIWSNDNRRPFLAMTAHWISEEPSTGTLKLKSVLLAFHRIRGNHSGKSLAKTILYLLDRAKTTAKVIVPLAQEGSQLIFSSSLRHDEFLDTVKTGNMKNWFKGPMGEAEQVPKLELLRDVPHKSMSFKADKRILQVPHKVQQHMSSESLPCLGSTVPCFELFMSAWEMLGATHPRVKPWTDVGLEWATKYYQRMDNTRAYIIAMFVDPAICMLWIKAYWDDEYIASAEKTVLEMVCH